MEIRLLLLVLLLCVASGCKDKSGSLPASRVRTDSPEGQFKWMVQKLERAVYDFSTTQMSGLTISDRKVKSQLIPPSDGIDHYRGRITISYETEYTPQELELPTLFDKEKEAEERREKMKQLEGYSGLDDEDSPLDREFRSEVEELAAKGGKPKHQPIAVESPKESIMKVYELAHLDGSWKLLTKLESESEQLWFDYALGKDLSR